MDPRRPARRDVLLTATAVVLILSFGAMCWWQVTRALSGNTLSWAYVFEWPLFAGYVVYMWNRLSHEGASEGRGAPSAAGDGAGSGPAAAGSAASAADDEEEDEELAAYNRYLASLESSGRRKRW